MSYNGSLPNMKAATRKKDVSPNMSINMPQGISSKSFGPVR
jgi:hypothetical protein